MVVNHPLADGGCVATHEDITEARNREESFRLLFDHNPLLMWVFDRASLRFIAVNDAAIAHYGFSRMQFMSMRAPDLRPPKDRPRFDHFIRNLLETQFAENIGQHVIANGTQIEIAAYSTTLNYAGHDARLTAIPDISKAKRAEKQLRSTERFLDAVIENVPGPILVKDVAGGARDASDSLLVGQPRLRGAVRYIP